MGIEFGVSVLLARRMGLWKRLRAVPVSRALLLASRIASGALVAAILLAIIFAVTLIMVMLGGAWVPTFIFPEWLQSFSLIVPTRWAIDGLDAVTRRGLGFKAALAPIGMMLAFSVVFGALAVARFDWEE